MHSFLEEHKKGGEDCERMRCAIYLVAFAVFASAVTAVAGNCAALNFTTCNRTSACSWCPTMLHADVGVCYNSTDGSRCCDAPSKSVTCSHSEACCNYQNHDNPHCCDMNSPCCDFGCCLPSEICEPFNGCVPVTFDCPSVNHAYVVKCKANLEICCGSGTMSPMCIPVNSSLKCCEHRIAATTCEKDEECCGGGGPGASSYASCCPPGARCCQTSGFGYSSCCSGNTTCCSGYSNSACCSPGARCDDGRCV